MEIRAWIGLTHSFGTMFWAQLLVLPGCHSSGKAAPPPTARVGTTGTAL